MVQSYMAHHQGMGLCALTNCLCGDSIRRRFMALPEIRAVEVPEDVMKMAQGATVRMEEASASLFSAYRGIMVSGDFLEAAQAGDYCFAERLPLPEAPETLILYRWNRVYPADVFLPYDLREWTLRARSEFPGYSHECITKEVYTR